MVTFDGGARTIRGHSVAAGAAIAWARQGEQWQRVQERVWIMPAGANSVIAESWGVSTGPYHHRG
eukprot:5207798-Lingulodinium_polyedra.AAC.1